MTNLEIALLLTPLVSACIACGGAAAPRGGVSVSADAIDTLITTESAMLGEVSDLLVGSDGSLYVADVQSNSVHVLHPDGRPAKTIGGTGAGPGEFRRPTSLVMLGDTLGVVDSDNGRLQLFSPDGALLGTRPVPGGYPPPVMGPRGWFVRPTLTLDSTLASVYDADHTVRARLGRIVGTPTNQVRPVAMKAEIQRGEVPGIFMNTAEAVWGSDGSIFLVVPARASIERFDSGAASRWIYTLEDSSFALVRSEFVRRNGEETRRFTPLRYILSTRAVGTDLWVLLGQSAYSQAVLVILDDEGRVERRLTFPAIREVSNFAVDETRGWIYFSTAETAASPRIRTESALSDALGS